MIMAVRDVEVARFVRQHKGWIVESRGVSSAVIAAGASRKTRERCHYPARRHFANNMVEGIWYVQNSCFVSRHSRHHTVRRHLSNGVIKCVRYIDVPRAVGSDAFWIVELRVAARAIGAARDSRLARLARERGHHATRRDLPDRAVITVRHI